MSVLETIESLTADALAQRADHVMAPTYPSFDGCLFVDGAGCTLTDHAGREYLDFTSGIGVTSLGHRSEIVAGALHRAADQLVHTSNLFGTAPAIELAARLVEHSFADRVYFGNSGAEAVEAALKFARLAGGPDRRRIVYFDHSFHGRTMGALAATDKEPARAPFTPLPGAYERAAFGADPAALPIDSATAAVIVEPVQGEGGVRPADPDWLRALRDQCDDAGAALIFDEIQCGGGRTGRVWAHEHSGVTPDLMTLAKPLAGGLPIGAVLMTQRIADAITPGSHGSTFGGNPVVATVACAVFDALRDPALLASVQRQGERLGAQLRAIEAPFVRDVRGLGLMWGIEFEPSVAAGDVVAAARERGLLLTSAGAHVVRLLPPLIVTDDEIDRATRTLGAVLHDLGGAA